MTDNFRHVEELRASRRRLVLAADADRRALERELHDGVQQQLVALAVNLQLAAKSLPAAKTLLDELGRDVQQALDQAARLAQRLYPPLVDAGGLAAALRSAAVSAGVRITLDVTAGASQPPEIAAAVYWCCLDLLEHAGAQATLSVRDENGAVVFELVEDGSGSAARVELARDRVEALGGRLTVRTEPGGGTRISGSLPLTG